MGTSKLIPDPSRIEAGFQWHMIGVDGVQPPVNYWTESNVVWQEFLKAMKDRGLMMNQAGIPIDSPLLCEFVGQLRSWKQQGRYRPNGHISFSLRQGIGIDWEWYEIHPKKEAKIDMWKLECAADKIPPTVWLDRWGTCSERFREFILGSGLTGLAFLWIPDKGRYRAPQWYYTYATEPLGRGIDHPFFEPGLLSTYSSNPSFSGSEYRYGVRSFSKRFFRKEAKFENKVINELIDQFAPKDLNLSSYGEFLRMFLPRTDFAYIWGGGLTTILCCNNSTRQRLIEARILSDDEFKPVWVWDSVPQGRIALDAEHIACRPGHRFPIERWPIILAESERRQQAFFAHPKPERPSDLTRTLKHLKKRRKEFERVGVTEKKPSDELVAAFAGRLPALPKAWLQALCVVNGFLLGKWEFHTLSKLAEFDAELEASARYFIPDLPAKLLHISTDGCGDWHSLDLGTLNAHGDCRVIEIDHESSAIRREWPSVAGFLDDLMDEAETVSDE